ncbi:uncharacterized protein LOC106721978 isoform X13 [Alligator sinensis]|uniref:Uncharacterized protein LOC106721978 isoform X13 n=1 Tax=Alligator sinensis TaxID=38654 RepID=A0A3Q0GAJ7_ALLSI|nr:uncharacterized protein LOC106721978 isoform X13 [Alligator sinensis]
MWRSSRQAAECCELKAVVTLASVTFIGQNMSSCCKTHTHIFPHIQEKGKGRETLYFSSYEPTGWEILQLCGTTSPVLLAAACVIHGDATITSPATAHTTEQPPMVMLSSGKVLTGTGTKLRIRRALGLFGIEESIGTIIGVVAAGIGGLVVLIIILTPQLRKCFLCIEQGPHQGRQDLNCMVPEDTRRSRD